MFTEVFCTCNPKDGWSLTGSLRRTVTFGGHSGGYYPRRDDNIASLGSVRTGMSIKLLVATIYGVSYKIVLLMPALT